MNASNWLDALALAAFELAEAETLERAAAAKRKKAAAILGAAHAEVRAAYDEAHSIKEGQILERAAAGKAVA